MVNRPRKIMMSIKSLEVAGGGAERVFVDLANYLINAGWKVDVVTLDHHTSSFYPLDPRVGFHNLSLNKPGTPTSLSSLIKFLFRNRFLARLLKPDVYISFMHSLYVPAQVSMLGSGVPFVASEHFRANYSGSVMQDRLVKWVSRLHHLKTLPSDSVRRGLDPFQQSRSVVLPNPVDDRFFVEPLSKLEKTQPLRILCVGRLMLEKNHLELFDAIHLIKDALNGWVVDLYGDGVDRAQLEARVAELGLQSLICFKGFSGSLELEYSDAEFTVIPSLYESFGLAAAESLAAGCPVVVFDCCLGVCELVKDQQNGLVVTTSGNRVEALAKSVLNMVDDQRLRSRLAACTQGSVQHLRQNVVMQQWEEVLSQISASKEN